MKEVTKADWESEAVRLFGEDRAQWRFICPVCGFNQSVQDYIDAGAPDSAIAFSCVGRWVSPSKDAFSDDDRPIPCNYAGGGLFRLNPVKIEGIEVTCFDFADREVDQSE